MTRFLRASSISRGTDNWGRIPGRHPVPATVATAEISEIGAAHTSGLYGTALGTVRRAKHELCPQLRARES
jgi:hypothetical protein